MPRVERTTLQRWTLLVLFAFAGYLFWQTLEPIWTPVFLGLVIAVGVYPLQEKLLRKFGGKHPGLAAQNLECRRHVNRNAAGKRHFDLAAA